MEVPMSWIQAGVGGVIIGLSVSFFLLMSGRVTGISGILYGALTNFTKSEAWRWAFVLGLIAGGFVLAADRERYFGGNLPTEDWTVVLAGLLVGFGTVLGSGCTSGHGVCGLSRFSPRSLVATLTFMAAGILSVVLMRQLGVVP